jgi:hypothetical protein
VKRKACSVCGKKKLITEYHVCRANRDNLDSRCKTCEKERHKLRRDLGKIASPKPDVCECCGKNPSQFAYPKPIVLDHDHKTKKIRGWLCGNCNIGIGKLGDNIKSVLNAVKYLKKCEIKGDIVCQ